MRRVFYGLDVTITFSLDIFFLQLHERERKGISIRRRYRLDTGACIQ